MRTAAPSKALVLANEQEFFLTESSAADELWLQRVARAVAPTRCARHSLATTAFGIASLATAAIKISCGATTRLAGIRRRIFSIYNIDMLNREHRSD